MPTLSTTPESTSDQATRAGIRDVAIEQFGEQNAPAGWAPSLRLSRPPNCDLGSPKPWSVEWLTSPRRSTNPRALLSSEAGLCHASAVQS
jgi:hypothetical protein